MRIRTFDRNLKVPESLSEKQRTKQKTRWELQLDFIAVPCYIHTALVEPAITPIVSSTGKVEGGGESG